MHACGIHLHQGFIGSLLGLLAMGLLVLIAAVSSQAKGRNPNDDE